MLPLIGPIAFGGYPAAAREGICSAAGCDDPTRRGQMIDSASVPETPKRLFFARPMRLQCDTPQG
jgi:hypothetical protein